MTKINDKLDVLNKQDTAEVEITIQEIARNERGKLPKTPFEKLTPIQQEYLLDSWEEEYREQKARDRELEKIERGKGL